MFKVGDKLRKKNNWKDGCTVVEVVPRIFDEQVIHFVGSDGRKGSFVLSPLRAHACDYEHDDGRAPWDVYFMQVAHLVATRATCGRKHVGAVLVRDRRILATGYNGAASGERHCDEVGHDLIQIDGRESCVRTIHAEQNVIAQAARYGIEVKGATLYVNTFPCWNVCAKLILGAGIEHVVYDSDYHNDKRVTEAFKAARISLTQFNHELL